MDYEQRAYGNHTSRRNKSRLKTRYVGELESKMDTVTNVLLDALPHLFKKISDMEAKIERMTKEQNFYLETHLYAPDNRLNVYILNTEDEVTCSICQEDIENGTYVRELSCKHTFHMGCIHRWFRRKRCCPTCRNTDILNE